MIARPEPTDPSETLEPEVLVASAPERTSSEPCVAYLGPQGSFSHAAVQAHFRDLPHTLLACADIPAIYEAVRTERATYGVAPIESLRQGPILESYLELKKAGPCRIVGEVYLPIQLYLAVNTDATLDAITVVRSKPEALRQCGNWLTYEQERRAAAGGPPLLLEGVSSTARAAALAAEHRESAAICSGFAARIYGLRTVGRNDPGHDGIQDLPDGASYTRFLVVGRTSLSRQECGTGRIKTSFRFILSHRIGSLVDSLLPFRAAGLSLEEIQPMPFRATHRQIEYVFFMDFLGHIADAPMIRAVRDAEETCSVEYLGSYPCAEMPQAALGPIASE